MEHLMVTTPKMMVAALWVLLISLFCPPASAETNDGAPRALSETECVILLHGLGRNHYVMDKMASRLEALGYTVWNEGYPSTEKPIQALVADHLRPAILWAESTGAKKIHFVTHSLGGILVRAYLQENTHPFIMQASDVIDQSIFYLQNGRFFRTERLKAEG
jgi:triacylglycerol esterase/lipase EstA (alpha/beta hydrolase family)